MLYEPSQDFCSKILSKLGVTTSWFDPLIGADIVKHLQPNTKIVFLESPGSITMEVHDVPAIVAAVRSVVPDAIIMIDNTWAAGVLFKALPTFFVADLPGKVEVDRSEVSLVYIVVEGPYRTRDGFLIRSKDMGQRLSLQKQRGNQTVQLFQGLRSLVNPRP